MASGKNAVGTLLAKELNLAFVDTDLLIEKKEKLSIPEIFDTKGETYFRDQEEEIILNLNKYNESVIATGGGVILRKQNHENIKKTGKIIYLKVDSQQVLERVKDHTSRPLLKGQAPSSKHQIIQELLMQREPIYEAMADFEVETVTGNPDQSVKDILSYLNKDKGV